MRAQTTHPAAQGAVESVLEAGFIRGTGMAVPDRVVSNADLEKIVDTTDEWIRTRSGIRERRACEEGQNTADMAALAARRALESARVDPLDVDDLLGSLVERSMLVVESGPFGRRFRLLETMRQFGAEHLSAAGQTDRVAERHARWCLDRVTRIGEQLAGPAEIEGVARLGELWPNLRAAVDWACATGDRHLARDLVRPVAAAGLMVLALAGWLGLARHDFALLTLAIACVWAAEAANTALEHLADVVSPRLHEGIRKAKDVAAAAVLLAAVGAAIVGLLVMGPPLLARLP